MTTDTILLIIWIVGAVIAGYFMARLVYRDDGYRPPHQLQAGNLWSALAVWVLFGAAWPLVALLFGLGGLADLCQKVPAKRIGDRIFGK